MSVGEIKVMLQLDASKLIRALDEANRRCSRLNGEWIYWDGVRWWR